AGFSSVTLGFRYNIYRDTARKFEFTGGAGFKIPWSRDPIIVNGVQLGQDIQPSDGAYGVVLKSFLYKEFVKSGVRVFMINIANFNGKNTLTYKVGATRTSALFFSKSFGSHWTPIMQVRYEERDVAYQYDLPVNSTGGYRFVFVPQINYTIVKNWNVSLLYELPIYQYYLGTQLVDKYSISLNMNIRFGMGKHHDECEAPKKSL
ncbi:MAG TPA: hypothetical protein VNX68_15900, partial [Nitrosopumilaceae archaeon]|nr:hypothetical protein [Nitrosopumilaceae archaeon]